MTGEMYVRLVEQNLISEVQNRHINIRLKQHWKWEEAKIIRESEGAVGTVRLHADDPRPALNLSVRREVEGGGAERKD